jgi:hypothetical protein
MSVRCDVTVSPFLALSVADREIPLSKDANPARSTYLDSASAARTALQTRTICYYNVITCLQKRESFELGIPEASGSRSLFSIRRNCQTRSNYARNPAVSS